MAVRIGDEPVGVVRDRKGDVRAYSNVCRHRGMALVEGTGKAAVLTCPYHAWSYDLDGALRKAPYMDEVEEFDSAACALPEFALEEWRGFLFVNTGNNAPPLARPRKGAPAARPARGGGASATAASSLSFSCCSA